MNAADAANRNPGGDEPDVLARSAAARYTIIGLHDIAHPDAWHDRHMVAQHAPAGAVEQVERAAIPIIETPPERTSIRSDLVLGAALCATDPPRRGSPSAATAAAADRGRRPRPHPRGRCPESTPHQRVRCTDRLRAGRTDLGARARTTPQPVTAARLTRHRSRRSSSRSPTSSPARTPTCWCSTRVAAAAIRWRCARGLSWPIPPPRARACAARRSGC